MVDDWPSRASLDDVLFNDPTDSMPGVAALAPQFDRAVRTPRRSARPIGSLSPEARSCASSSLASSLPKSYCPFPAVRLAHPSASPPGPAADFLADCTQSVTASSIPRPATQLLHQTSMPPFDLFSLAALDLGPPVVPPPAALPSTPPSTVRHSSPPPFMFSHSLPLPASQLQSQSQSQPVTPRTPRDPPHPTRCVLLRNLPPGVDDDDLRTTLSRFGPLRDLGAQQRARGGRGSIIATYYDLRHARDAVRGLDGAVHFGRRLDARFQCPTDVPGANNGSNGTIANHGTLVVFNLDASTAADDVRTLFAGVGDVKEIRATPNKKHHKFVEFYDVRDAERALMLLNKTEVGGKRIKIEISRPGGRAAGTPRAGGAPAKSTQSPVASHTPTSNAWRAPRASAAMPTAPLAVPRASANSQTDDDILDALSTSFPPLGFANGDPSAMPRSLDRSATLGVRTEDEDARRLARLYGLSTMGTTRAREGLNCRIGLGPRPGRDSYMQALYHSPSSDEGQGVASPGTEDSPQTAFGSMEDSNGHVHDDFHSVITDGRVDRMKSMQTGGSKASSSGSFGNGHCGNGKYALDLDKVRSGEETRTALMIRNIPNKYNQKMLVSTLEEKHKGHFDFIYLPIDFKNKCNVGYAFINLTKPEYIESFYQAFHGKKWGRFNSEKVCEITYARIQGRQQLIAHFQNSSLLLEDPKCRPVIFDPLGRQEEFPVGSHVRTRRGPSSRDGSHRGASVGGDGGISPPYSPPKHRSR